MDLLGVYVQETVVPRMKHSIALREGKGEPYQLNSWKTILRLDFTLRYMCSLMLLWTPMIHKEPMSTNRWRRHFNAFSYGKETGILNVALYYALTQGREGYLKEVM